MGFGKIKYSPLSKSVVWVLLLALFIFQSCSSTKYLKENQYLLSDNTITVDNKSIDKSELSNYTFQKPNKGILGWYFYLSLYNMVDPDKEMKRDIKREKELKIRNQKRIAKGKKPIDDPFYLRRWWRNTVGEAPIIYDAYSIEESKKSMKAYLRNLGYYHSQISDSVALRKEKYKARVYYNIRSGNPYLISELDTRVSDPRIDSLLINNTLVKFPKKGDLFNSYNLDDTRYQISEYLQNEGYFNFGPDQVLFYVDTIAKTREASIDMEIFNTNAEGENKTNNTVLTPSYIKNISIVNFPYYIEYLNPEIQKNERVGTDSLKVSYYDKLTIKSHVLLRRFDIHRDSLYRQSDIANTTRALGQLGVFRSTHFKITPSTFISDSDSAKYLDCEIQLSPTTGQSYSVDLEGYTSSGSIGTGIVFNYSHRNLFKRAIYFNLSLNGKLERFSSNLIQQNLYAYEYGINSSVRFPKFFSPFPLHKFDNKYFPSTVINLNYTHKDRHEYVRQTSSLGFGYSWNTPKGIRHNLNPIDFYLTAFKSINYDYILYLIDKNLYDQYFDHVIPAGNYSIFYTNQKIESPKDYFLVNLRVELAGNLFNLANEAFQTNKSGSGDLYIKVIRALAQEFLPDSAQQSFVDNLRDSLNAAGPGYYTFNGLIYNQYFKGDVDLRYTWFFGKDLSVSTRVFGGVIVPYGNTNFSPIEKQYFMGGANDLRAWWARSIGPGGFILDEQTLQLKDYYQHGDIKLLGSIELRHPIIWRIKGALFADVGNVWNIYANESFPDGLFTFNNFYRQMAVGAGYGLRVDFSFFIIRFDYAFKLIDPTINSSNKFVYAQGESYYKKPILNFGIGLPF
jgi:outer membrane protein assembly factor BamA